MYQAMNLMTAKQADAGLDDAKDTMAGFMIMCLVAAVFQFFASILFSMWCCCGAADLPKSSKYAFYAAICQTVAFLVFTCSWLLVSVIDWNFFISCFIDLLFYVYIVLVAKRYHAQEVAKGSQGEQAAPIGEPVQI